MGNVGSYDSDTATTVMTVLFATGGISVIFCALRAICMVGQTACCLCEVCLCARRCCCLGGGGKSDENSAAAPYKYPLGAGRYGSMILMFLAILYAMIWQFYWAEDLGDADSTKAAWSQGGCVEGNDKYPLCLSYSASYRVSFCEVVLFGTMAVLSAFKPAAHDLGWDIKALVFILLVVGITWAPSDIFDEHGYVWFARVGAFIFLVLQQIILLDGGYRLNDYLKAIGGPEQAYIAYADVWNKWLSLLLGLSIFFYLTAFVGIVLLFVYYTGQEDDRCATSTTFVSLTLVLIVVSTVLQLLSDPDNGHNLLVSSIVAAYVVYLTFVSVSANPVSHCNPSYDVEGSDTFSLVLGLAITFVSICGTVYFASKSVTELAGGKGSPASNYVNLDTVLTTDVKGPQPGGEGGSVQAAEQGAASAYPAQALAMLAEEMNDGGTAWRFNVVMMLISMYWCMVLTNWANPVTGDDVDAGHPGANVTAGNAAMWMNASASWICVLLYIWTLVAPRLYPDRDFT